MLSVQLNFLGFISPLARKFKKAFRSIKNLRLLIHALDQMYSPEHIRELEYIHQLMLAKNWTQTNTETWLRQHYQSLLDNQNQREILKSHEVKLYAQNGEDGLLLYLFSRIGVKNRTFVDFACGGSSNTANLIINFGWQGLYLGGTQSSVKETEAFFQEKIGDTSEKLTIWQRWITKDNINQILTEAGIKGEIDLLSIDIDGNDYWVWQAIEVISPRVVMIEYNASFGCQRSVAIPYEPEFDIYQHHRLKFYHGASLTALTKLGKEKGYTLIGCESKGINAFFLRNDLLGDNFTELEPETAFYPHSIRLNWASQAEQFEQIKHLELVEI